MTKIEDTEDLIDFGAASAETKGSNDHLADDVIGFQLPRPGLSND